MQAQSAPPAAGTAESEWIEGELVRSLMATARGTQYIGLLVIAVMAGILAGHTPLPALLAWVAVSLAMSAYRIGFMTAYARQVSRQAAPQRVAFMARHAWSWPLSALVWGLSVALFFDRAPLETQFLCWLIVAGLGMFSLNSFSAHLSTMRAYLNTLSVTMLAALLWRMGVELGFRGPAHHWWMVALVGIIWLLLLQAAKRLHRTHRRNFELQYRNAQLIESLTRQTQAALDAVEVKNRFLASAAHDIRQPVHALGLYADWLGNEPELVHELAPKIVESTKAVNALFDSLFDLVRLDSGKVTVRVEPIRVTDLLHDLEVQYRPLAKAKGLDFRVRGAPGEIRSDPILLQRILGNLLSNSVKYTERGGILLAARVTGEVVRVEVWDTGVGIAPEHQDEVFREFFKVPVHHGTEDGFGLGLAIVSRLTTILGHRLSLRSRPGRGTVFRLELQHDDTAGAALRAQQMRDQFPGAPPAQPPV